ncbi:MAG: hypothetical protein FWG53_03850 [Clostridiales bacterium]|nr:hypothetical protein [Clostridiales bacterium]
MDGIVQVLALLQEGNGYLTTKESRKNGITNKTMQRMAESKLIDRAAHGLYIGADIFPDQFFIAQYRCPKGIFSNETSLFLHDLSDRNPFRLMMTIPTGWNTKLLTDENYLFFYCNPQRMKLGVCEVETPFGMTVKSFNVEWTLCDCLKNIDKLDRDLVLSAWKRYAKSNGKDITKLLEYAATLKIRDMVYRYLEVLV